MYDNQIILLSDIRTLYSMTSCSYIYSKSISIKRSNWCVRITRSCYIFHRN